MPTPVVLLERFAYGFLGLNILGGLLEIARVGDVAAFGLWNVIAYVVIAALIWFAAKRRKNWARWGYAVVVVLLVGLTILFFSPLPPLWYVLIMGASELLGIISLFYLYSAAASAWFRSPL
jgi:hypothetical protein